MQITAILVFVKNKKTYSLYTSPGFLIDKVIFSRLSTSHVAVILLFESKVHEHALP